jgi:hypothetical protein
MEFGKVYGKNGDLKQSQEVFLDQKAFRPSFFALKASMVDL